MSPSFFRVCCELCPCFNRHQAVGGVANRILWAFHLKKSAANFRSTGIGEYYLDTLIPEQVEEAILLPTSTRPLAD